MAKEQIIVALDGTEEAAALQLAEQLSGKVWGFKVNDLLLASGVEIVTRLKSFGNVFADPKLYDIPNTVANGVKRLADAGADLITVHASGGINMLEQAVATSGDAEILAITVLTSSDGETVRRVYNSSTEETVISLAKLANTAGVDGVVCSPNELELLAKHSELKDLLKVTPGIRPQWYQLADDQTRVATPATAIKNGASYLVIGRPITSQEDPVAAVDKIAAEL